jgi:hypothetical protein
MSRLEDNLWFPFVLAAAVAALFHWRARRHYLLASLAASLTAACVWMAVLSISNGLSNIWPIALVSWTMLSLPVALLVGLPFLLRRKRRVPGTCLRCGYSLTGNVSGVCPECGSVVPSAEAAR